MTELVDLDHNATTAPAPDVVAAMLHALRELGGNPSSAHRQGRAAAAAIAQARGEVAALLGCADDEVVFTSGGTESDNMAVLGGARARAEDGAARHVVSTNVEHPAVEEPLRALEAEGFEVTRVPVRADGRVRADDVAAALRPATALVTVMHANNETGAVMPLAAVAAACRAGGVPVHTDAAQSVGKLALDVGDLGVDLLTVAGHKLYGPKGVGALYVRRGTRLQRIQYGAGHERGLRPGTENTAGIVGLGAACKLAHDELDGRVHTLQGLRDRLEQRLRAELPELVRHGPDDDRLPNTLYASIPGVDARQLVAELGDQVALSTGSACHAAGDSRSAVLVAMGVADALASAAVRMSLGRDNDEEQVDRAAARIAAVAHELRTS